MSDYIKREDAIEAVNKAVFKDVAWDNIAKLPSADVVEVKHGRWMECVSLLGKSICSNCQIYWIDTDSQYDFNYCPRCGARMDGKEQEHEGSD